MIVDAHQHFIKFDPAQYPWIAKEMVELRRDFLPADLASECLPLGVATTVAVQARQSIAETNWLLDLAADNLFISGVVGWVDLCAPDVDGVLERYAERPSLVGVRHVIHDEPDDDFILRPELWRGIAALRKHRLTYDILVFSRHLPQTLTFVRAFPDQPFVVDHIGKPSIGTGEFHEWRQNMRLIASCDNAYCKISGMVTEAVPHKWYPEDFRPYIETVLELFGPERAMFGSDWPVCTLQASYRQVLSIVQETTSKLTSSERAMILGGTASAFYGLPDRQER